MTVIFDDEMFKEVLTSYLLIITGIDINFVTRTYLFNRLHKTAVVYLALLNYYEPKVNT